MSRILNIAGAQLGPIGRNESRKTVVSRMCELLKQAKDKNCDLVVFPELTLISFNTCQRFLTRFTNSKKAWPIQRNLFF